MFLLSVDHAFGNVKRELDNKYTLWSLPQFLELLNMIKIDSRGTRHLSKVETDANFYDTAGRITGLSYGQEIWSFSPLLFTRKTERAAFWAALLPEQLILWYYRRPLSGGEKLWQREQSYL